MAEKDLILKEKVEHSGLFDFPGLYSYSYTWFKDKSYGVNEDKYSEKISGNKRDLTVEWKATKKLSDYFKIEISVKFEITEMTEVEVEIEGKTRKMNKGKVTVEFKGTLIKDYDGKWETSAFSKFWRDVYNKYVIPSRVFEINNKVESDVRELKEELKAYLELSARRRGRLSNA